MMVLSPSSPFRSLVGVHFASPVFSFKALPIAANVSKTREAASYKVNPDGSRFLRLTSAISASLSDDDASGSSNGSNSSSSGSAFGGPGVAQALCELKPAAAPTINVSQQAQQQQQQQSPRQLSLSFFARASLCAEGEEGAEGEAERLLKVLLLAVPLNASGPATAGGDGTTGGGGEGGAGEQVWAEWRVGVPCGGSRASLSGALPWFQVGPLLFPLPDPPDSSSSSSASSPSSLVVPPGGVALHLVIRANPSPLKCFSHWPLSRVHPLLTAGSARRNSSSLALTTLSNLNSAALALHPVPFALLAPATPASPCRPFSFSTSFAFRISSPNAAGLGGEGLAFVMLPTPTLGLPGPSLGYGRVPLPPGSTTGADHSSDVSSQQWSMAVEFDTSSSPEFFDHPDHHVGVNLHGSMLSLASAPVHSLTLLLFLFCSLLLLLCRSAVLLLLLLLLPPLSFPPPSMQQQRSLAVEFDTSSSPEFFDRPDHHVGVNLHGSMLSLASAPVHPLGIPALNAGQPFLATIRYNASSSQLTVWLSPVPRSSSRSASSFFAPPLPRSAVLTTFLDTCEWLGGNDPQAAAPPPPLFVGFTAATGKGAEQAQAHEVLGWSFEVGEVIPLHTPRSHPPSAPTDTDPCKGSPVLPCGTGACTKARAPWDPSILVPSCKCPFNLPSFQPSHLAGLPSCFPGEAWSGGVW
ncbi:unnamed protein product [Closterium sp. NIES-65]|nr:unnamed protein product [Closterium sp. NIES-65]